MNRLKNDSRSKILTITTRNSTVYCVDFTGFTFTFLNNFRRLYADYRIFRLMLFVLRCNE